MSAALRVLRQVDVPSVFDAFIGTDDDCRCSHRAGPKVEHVDPSRNAVRQWFSSPSSNRRRADGLSWGRTRFRRSSIGEDLRAQGAHAGSGVAVSPIDPKHVRDAHTLGEVLGMTRRSRSRGVGGRRYASRGSERCELTIIPVGRWHPGTDLEVALERRFMHIVQNREIVRHPRATMSMDARDVQSGNVSAWRGLATCRVAIQAEYCRRRTGHDPSSAPLGWVAHYSIGVTLALVFVVLASASGSLDRRCCRCCSTGLPPLSSRSLSCNRRSDSASLHHERRIRRRRGSRA